MNKTIAPRGGKMAAMVIAAVQCNGQEHELLRTPEGLKYCRVQDLGRVEVWKPVNSLTKLVDHLANGTPDEQVRVYWSGRPNDPRPKLDRGCVGLQLFQTRRLDLTFDHARGAVVVRDKEVPFL